MEKKSRKIWRCVLALILIGAGINHFIMAKFYNSIMPDYIPFHSELVMLTGWIQIGLGILLLFQKTKQLAGPLIIAMLIVYLSVHIDMAVHAQDKFGFIPNSILWVRLPVQFLLIYLTWWSTKPEIKNSGKLH